MKILYSILPLLISVAPPSFAQNYIFQSNNQFDAYKQALNNYSNRDPRRQKDHRGSGRRSYYIDDNY